MKQITYSKQSRKVLRAMQKPKAKAIIARIEDYALGRNVDAKPMRGSGFIRIRIGQWRVIVDEDGTVINVLKIGSRGDVYK